MTNYIEGLGQTIQERKQAEEADKLRAPIDASGGPLDSSGLRKPSSPTDSGWLNCVYYLAKKDTQA